MSERPQNTVGWTLSFSPIATMPGPVFALLQLESTPDQRGRSKDFSPIDAPEAQIGQVTPLGLASNQPISRRALTGTTGRQGLHKHWAGQGVGQSQDKGPCLQGAHRGG